MDKARALLAAKLPTVFSTHPFVEGFYAQLLELSELVLKMGDILEPGTVIKPEMDASCAEDLLLRPVILAWKWDLKK